MNKIFFYCKLLFSNCFRMLTKKFSSVCAIPSTRQWQWLISAISETSLKYCLVQFVYSFIGSFCHSLITDIVWYLHVFWILNNTRKKYCFKSLGKDVFRPWVYSLKLLLNFQIFKVFQDKAEELNNIKYPLLTGVSRH